MAQSVCGATWDNWLSALQGILQASGDITNATNAADKQAATDRLAMWKGVADQLYNDLIRYQCINPQPAPQITPPATGA